MKTLIIHPQDSSTDFLKVTYRNIKDKTVVTGDVTQRELKGLMKIHDRIMMMGHGSPNGLFSVGKFGNTKGYIIDESMIDILSQRDNSVYIWCNADMFVDRFKLRGFYSGMFVSEVLEARYCGLSRKVDQGVVDESNFEFVALMDEYRASDDMPEKVIQAYRKFAQSNEVAGYNSQRLYVRG
jgi:hypothetical protein